MRKLGSELREHVGQNSNGSKGKKVAILLVPALAAAIGIGAIVGVSSPAPSVQAAETVAAQRGIITVAGQGQIKVTPDVAYITLGVETRATTAKEAQSLNAKAFAAIDQMLYTTYKLSKKDVQTTSFYVQPQYQYNEKDGTSKVVSYTATNMVEVTVRDLTQIGAMLDNLSAAGANRIDGVRFDTEKQEQYELQAMEKAMANAKVKAETLAKAAGRSVKQVVNITQGNVSSSPIFQGNVMMEAATADKATSSVQAGEITVSTDVTVSYEMQ
ncbi:hypothetical protein FHS18_005272 [Paenibacillus phyllosphaerae]|uniref:SIMPL domain-containing protein n=1 Tax=Paenibacillus phyllosphaerae TaxID=274593 RepID=A0A7W5B2W5_9BACL|nr:SIMPL domain-containing protein [Paenibacillus phyllosphaerae]MBB3113169.1 hypothetical protein [Paenibacillus phyllosphaerae]